MKPTDRFLERGFQSEAVVVLYTKSEEIGAPAGLFVPLWVGTDLTDERHGVFASTGQPVLCTWKQMEQCARRVLSGSVAISREAPVFACHYVGEGVPLLNGMSPFRLEESAREPKESVA
jgi:hypothetical protein